MRSVLLITPPLLQPNTPYPATPCLAGFLEAHGIPAAQADLSLELLLRLFSADGLRQVEAAVRRRRRRTPATRHFLAHAAPCRRAVEPAIAFLQGRSDALAPHLAAGRLPEGPRFRSAECGMWNAEAKTRGPATRRPTPDPALLDSARHRASLFLDDLADAIRDGVDRRFAFARYAERLAVSAPRFDPLRRSLEARPTLLDRMLDELTDAALAAHRPSLVGLTVPFPGTLYGALRIARRVRRVSPHTRVVLGGGYVNTELRGLDDPRVFDYADFVCFDDGEEPLLRIARSLADPTAPLVRTLVRVRGKVVRCGVGEASVRCSVFSVQRRDPSRKTGSVTISSRVRSTEHWTLSTEHSLPAFTGLPLDRYFSLAESPNPLLRLWSDGRWLKLQLAHGCYWHQCRFCDTALDHIGRYAPLPAGEIVRRMVALHGQTGLSGFHFTDEALAPALLRQVSRRLVARRAGFAWWGNIRFERAFDPALARLLARAGCVAVTGGLECAHDRLLGRMQKGVTLAGAEAACRALAAAGIGVHLYLMYGFPTQTARETVEGLEFVRRLFAAGVVQSAYWHRFALTCHSPIARDPAAFGIRIRRPRRTPGRTFAVNELAYDEPGAPDHETLGRGLRRATYNYCLGAGLDEPVQAWFDAPVPRPAAHRPT
jgi:radical SAM superfamily enzyme YgiQ (UPF0313 family)